MRVLVTGAAGRVGANLVKQLSDAGREITAMVMPGDPQATKVSGLPGVRIVEADLGDQQAVDHAMEGITHVAHLAAQLVRGDTPVDRFYDINAFGTLRLLEATVQQGIVLDRFVLVSTDGTYRPGDPPRLPLTEDTPQEPADYYGTAKLLGEIILRNHAAQFDIPFSIIRFATVISPEEAPAVFTLGYWRRVLGRAHLGRDTNIWQLFRDHPEMGELLEAAAAGADDATPIVLRGPDGHPWSLHLTDVRDAVQGVLRALLEPAGRSGGAYNIAAERATSHDEGARVLSEFLGHEPVEATLPVLWRLEVSVDAAMRDLAYRPAFDYRAMVKSGVAGPVDYIPAMVS